MLCLNNKTKVTCIQCKESFLSYEGNFYKSKVCNSGYKGQCIKCCTANSGETYRRNAHIRAKQKVYRDTIRSEKRKAGQYKETQQAYYEKANKLRRESYKFKRILRIVGKMKVQSNKYIPIDTSYLTEEQMLNNIMEIHDGHKWIGSESREISMLDQNKKTI